MSKAGQRVFDASKEDRVLDDESPCCPLAEERRGIKRGQADPEKQNRDPQGNPQAWKDAQETGDGKFDHITARQQAGSHEEAARNEEQVDGQFAE